MKEPRKHDSGAAYVRQAIAQRRIGIDARCSCGESRPKALNRRGRTVVCAECERKPRGHTIMDKHHIAGKNNSAVAIDVPANDHRAELSTAQLDWPKETVENPDGSPLRSAAAHIRGFVDMALYLIEKCLFWVAEMLERLDAQLSDQLGPKWWNETGIAEFAERCFHAHS